MDPLWGFWRNFRSYDGEFLILWDFKLEKFNKIFTNLLQGTSHSTIDTIFDRILINIYRATHEKFQKKVSTSDLYWKYFKPGKSKNFSFCFCWFPEIGKFKVFFFHSVCISVLQYATWKKKLFSLKVLETCLSVNQFLFCLRFDLNGRRKKNCNFSILSKTQNKKFCSRTRIKIPENLVQG